jgi:hypothetical protein
MDREHKLARLRALLQEAGGSNDNRSTGELGSVVINGPVSINTVNITVGDGTDQKKITPDRVQGCKYATQHFTPRHVVRAVLESLPGARFTEARSS